MEEFHPAWKRSLPLGFVFIPVINQIPRESWMKFKGEGRQQHHCILLLPLARTFTALRCVLNVLLNVTTYFLQKCQLPVTDCYIINGGCFRKNKRVNVVSSVEFST